MEAAGGRRDTREVIDAHLARRAAGDLEGDLRENYSPDVVVLSAEGVHHGHDGVRTTAGVLRTYVPDGRYDYRQVLAAGRFALLQWTGRSEQTRIHDGADSYVVEDGLIVAQTIHYSVTDREQAPD